MNVCLARARAHIFGRGCPPATRPLTVSPSSYDVRGSPCRVERGRLGSPALPGSCARAIWGTTVVNKIGRRPASPPDGSPGSAAENVTRMSITEATTSSSGADRVRRYRERKAAGRHVARIEVGAEEIEALVQNDLLAAEKVGDRVAINAALDDLLYVLSEGAVEIDFSRWD